MEPYTTGGRVGPARTAGEHDAPPGGVRSSSAISGILRDAADEIAQATVDLQYELKPELTERYGAAGKKRCVVDTRHHVGYLADAVLTSSELLFADYVLWARSVMESRSILTEDLALGLECLRVVLQDRLTEEQASVTSGVLGTALLQLEGPLPSEGNGGVGAPLGTLSSRYLDLLLSRDRAGARALMTDALAGGGDIKYVYSAFEQTQMEIGRLWQVNRVTVAQEHFCTAATQQIMAGLYSYVSSARAYGPTAVVACVSGELHELGARMVADYLEMDGWNAHYLGANTPPEEVVRTAAELKADLIGVSVTSPTRLHQAAELIRSARSNPATAAAKIMVGGYPFRVDRELWRRVGADGFCCTGADIAGAARRLLDA